MYKARLLEPTVDDFIDCMLRRDGLFCENRKGESVRILGVLAEEYPKFPIIGITDSSGASSYSPSGKYDIFSGEYVESEFDLVIYKDLDDHSHDIVRNRKYVKD